MLGLWTGLGPNLARNSLMNAVELASYDQCKQLALGRLNLRDCFSTHVFCATLTAAALVLFGSPADVLKSRVMNQPLHGRRSVPQLIRTMLAVEGISAFYKGATANFIRQASWVTVAFVTLE